MEMLVTPLDTVWVGGDVTDSSVINETENLLYSLQEVPCSFYSYQVSTPIQPHDPFPSTHLDLWLTFPLSSPADNHNQWHQIMGTNYSFTPQSEPIYWFLVAWRRMVLDKYSTSSLLCLPLSAYGHWAHRPTR